MDQKHMMEERENNYTLTLENVRESNLGEYTCSAVNKIGDGQAVVFLTGTKILQLMYLLISSLFECHSALCASDIIGNSVIFSPRKIIGIQSKNTSLHLPVINQNRRRWSGKLHDNRQTSSICTYLRKY